MVEMRGGQGVWAGKVPDKISAAVPGVQGGAIRPLAISPEKAGWLQLGMNAERTDCPDDDVVSEGVTAVTTGATSASETMVSILADPPPHAVRRSPDVTPGCHKEGHGARIPDPGETEAKRHARPGTSARV